MIKNIQTVFEKIPEIPLFYVESGSRLWGIASSDSDYDVRGFHLLSQKQYFDFKKHRQIIELMEKKFDFVSYDIDKMFELLAKSNPTVLEWVRSPTVYFNELSDWEILQNGIMANFDYKALFYHYLSLAKHNLRLLTGKKFSYKKVFYCIHGLLCADLSAKKIIPELLIDRLFQQFDQENEILKIAKTSLEHKKTKTEREEVPESERKEILAAIKNFLKEMNEKKPESNNNREKLEKILTDYSCKIKTIFYR